MAAVRQVSQNTCSQGVSLGVSGTSRQIEHWRSLGICWFCTAMGRDSGFLSRVAAAAIVENVV